MSRKTSGPGRSTGFAEGFRDGIPIAMGYFAVAFSLGITARSVGMNWFQGFISSILNHASAGEYAEFTVIKAGAPYIEMALIILVTNARYLLMSCALSQRFDPATGLIHRIFVGFGITDEIFGASIGRKGNVDPYYHYGAMIIAIPCWACGTALGITAGNILPVAAVSALSVALYGMFLAIIIPPARENRIIAVLIVVSFALSYIATHVSLTAKLSGSMRTILLTVVITAGAAVLFPVKEDGDES